MNGPGVPMSRLLAAELLRIRTTRVVWGLGAACVALAVLGAVSALATAAPSGLDPAAEPGVRPVLAGVGAGWLFALCVGILSMAGEYRHATATATFTAQPKRHRVVVAKIGATAVCGLGFGLAATAATLAVAIPWLAIVGAPLPLGRAELWQPLAGTLLATATYGPLGVALGGLLRHQVTALAVALAYGLLVEPVIAVAWPDVAKHLVNGAASGLTQAPGEHLSAGVGGALFAAYVITLAALGTRAVVARDIA